MIPLISEINQELLTISNFSHIRPLNGENEEFHDILMLFFMLCYFHKGSGPKGYKQFDYRILMDHKTRPFIDSLDSYFTGFDSKFISLISVVADFIALYSMIQSDMTNKNTPNYDGYKKQLQKALSRYEKPRYPMYDWFRILQVI